MSDEAAFLAVLKANPTDDTARLVYADWLDEHDEPRKAEYLRFVVSLAQREGNLVNADDHKLLLRAGKGLLSEWREKAGSRFNLILDGYDDMIRAMKWVRELTGDGLGEARQAIKELPNVLLCFITFEHAWGARKSASSAGNLALRIAPTDPDEPDGPAAFELIVHCSAPRYTVGDVTEARAALVKFLREVVKLSEEEATHRATLNQGIVYRNCLTRQQALSELSAVGDALPPYDNQQGWWISVTFRRTPVTSPNV